jgi:mRNA-degrading endonuclease RelE of RelBE toxin-antitoxin system
MIKKLNMVWQVHLSKSAEKQYEKLKKSGRTRPSIVDVIDFLIIELKEKGPERNNWPNYCKLSKYTYHCHLKKGHPTYVACWEIMDPKFNHIEVYYVGTHEGAPY